MVKGLIREEKIRRLLILASGIACLVTSILYVLVAVTPIYYFHGYVRGYYSILDYRLYYVYSEQPVPMPHTDYIRHVSVTFTLLSTAFLSLSITSIILAWLRPLAASGLIYGASAGLAVLHGLLGGYILRAVSLDMDRFGYLMQDLVFFKTLAGTITFEGVRLQQTFIRWLALSTPLLIALLAAAVLASCAAAALSLHAIYRRAAAEEGPSGWSHGLRQVSAYTALSLLAFASLASVFTYYPSTIAVSPQPPPATLEAPPYLYTCTVLTRTARGALTYTDFETYPVSGWASSGGTWSSVNGVPGAKGKVLQGSDNNMGLGDASHYYYNMRLDTYSGLWVVAKTKWVSGIGYYGISMMDHDRDRLFAVEINTTGYFEIWSYNVIPPAQRWVRHARVSIPNYNQANWYIIVVTYEVIRKTITIDAHLYDADGSYVTNTSATITHGRVFTPAYIGVIVDGLTAYFDDFIISTDDSRSNRFTGFYSGMMVEVWDNLGNLVNSGTATEATLRLSVVHDVVVGTGVNGRIVVKCPGGYPCGVLTLPTSDAILGGDAYSLETGTISVSLGANKTSSKVTIYISGSSLFNTTTNILRVNSSQVLYARLILDSILSPSTLNASLWLEGVTRSTSITIRSGAPISASTSIVQLNLGLNNLIILTGYFSTTGQTATLYLRLELYTAEGGLGACIHYPMRLDVKS